MNKCYIAGKIGQLPEHEYKLNFINAKNEVAALGMDPVSPVDLPHNHDKTWASYMREDLIAMLACSHVYAQQNWRQSPGATIEVSLALQLGLNVIFQGSGVSCVSREERILDNMLLDEHKSEIIESFREMARSTPFSHLDLRAALEALRGATPKQGALRSVRRFAWMPVLVNLGRSIAWLVEYNDVEERRDGRWVKTGVKNRTNEF